MQLHLLPLARRAHHRHPGVDLQEADGGVSAHLRPAPTPCPPLLLPSWLPVKHLCLPHAQ